MKLKKTIYFYFFIRAIQLQFTASQNLEEEEETASSSSNWNLSNKERAIIRRKGYCAAKCGVGFDESADGFGSFKRLYHEKKHTKEYDQFYLASGGNYEAIGIDYDEIAGMRFQPAVLKMLNFYCKKAKLPLDDCVDFENSYLTCQLMMKCIDYCEKNLAEMDIMPDFDDMDPQKQEYETCLDNFDASKDIFDNHLQGEELDVDEMVRVMKKNGFVIVKNFFPRSFMQEITRILHHWDDTGEWNNLNYEDFYCHYEKQLNSYENRLELAVPYIAPFDKLFYEFHNSTLLEVMRRYGNGRPINMEFPSIIMSRPGALQQGTHGDHQIDEGMIKVSIAIHDIHEINGPTSFCACTHKYGNAHYINGLDCAIRFHLDYIPAGSVTIYDQSLKHRGSANKGDIRRYILDLSYMIDSVFSAYESTYPKPAQEHIYRYRKDFQNI